MPSAVKNPRCWIILLSIGYITKSRHCSWWLAMLMDFNSNWNSYLLVLSYPMLHSLPIMHLSDLYIGLRTRPDLKPFISCCKHAQYLWTRLVISVKRVHVLQFIYFKIRNNILSLIYSSKLCNSTQISIRSPDGTVLVPAVPSKAKRTAGMAVIGVPSQSLFPLGGKGTDWWTGTPPFFFIFTWTTGWLCNVLMSKMGEDW